MNTRLVLKDNIGRHIAVSYRHMAKRLVKKLQPFGLGAGQYPYILALMAEDGQSQKSLSVRMVQDKAAVTRTLKKLLRAGFVRRMSDKDDGRRFRIFLTAKAWKLQSQVEEAVQEVIEESLQGFSERDRIAVRKLMARITANLLPEG